ncbi:peptidase [Pedobacter sp. G11]|uniref:M1 family metallopeptidase n=1 Tax=Pedobacter sp. G11 TaxID=2482728 RepID=UPI000F6020CA|nr:M1 family metallopeptidase [Pedobacter sp. G11]AZI26415.1 peptidase [Pedobacter sp. G11]
MSNYKFYSFFSTIYLIFIFATELSAQTLLPLATNFKPAYSKQTRSNEGLPGKNYWQNSGDYDIRLKFDPIGRVVEGKVNIKYFNNSPDTLKQIVFKLYPNLYQAQAMRNVHISPDDLTAGVEIKKMELNASLLDKKKYAIRGTNMFVKSLRVLPGDTTCFDIEYQYTLNKGSFMRTGQVDSGAFMIAYFFPRIAVYDDIDGWNEYPYIGKEEFYNDYGNFKVDIEVPKAYSVWATGTLLNAPEIFQKPVLERLQEAENNGGVIEVITRADLDNNLIFKERKSRIWHFEAKEVSDFAFSVSNHYVWKAKSIMTDPKTRRHTRVDAVYNPDHTNFDPVVGYAAKTVDLISSYLPAVPFPYPHITIFEGLDAMEYPMMVNDLPFEGDEAVELTAHEVFHTMFPFYVGSNETKYSFIDEGLATFSEFTFGPLINPDMADHYDLSAINVSAGTDHDVPVMTPTQQLYGNARFSNKDLKPALGLRYVREMLGEEKFNVALRYYISRWAGKHPSPYDFFNCMNQGSGVNLNWFWINWFFEKNTPDLSISRINKKLITVQRTGAGMVPVHLKITYADGTVRNITKNIGCWQSGLRNIDIPLPSKPGMIKVVLGDGFDADTDVSNNTWTNKMK